MSLINLIKICFGLFFKIFSTDFIQIKKNFFCWVGVYFFQGVRPSVHRDRQIDTQTSFYFYIKIIAVLESYQKYCTYTKQGC